MHRKLDWGRSIDKVWNLKFEVEPGRYLVVKGGFIDFASNSHGNKWKSWNPKKQLSVKTGDHEES